LAELQEQFPVVGASQGLVDLGLDAGAVHSRTGEKEIGSQGKPPFSAAQEAIFRANRGFSHIGVPGRRRKGIMRAKGRLGYPCHKVAMTLCP